MQKEARNAKYLDLKYLGGKKEKAVFLKTEDNCYFLSCFSSFLPTINTNKEITLILKDFFRNEKEEGKKAYFGQIVSIGKNNFIIKTGDHFCYHASQSYEITEKITQIKFGLFETVEKHFLDNIKKMSEEKLN